MKYVLIALTAALSQSIFAAEVAPQKVGLIVTIDQKKMGNLEQMDTAVLKQHLNAAQQLGTLGQAFGGLINKLDNLKPILAWDAARADWIRTRVENKYDKYIIVLGDKTRDDAHMKQVWAEMLEECDVLDYVSFVHEQDQLIKDAWAVPADTKQIRMVYSEACQGGAENKPHFVEKYNALIAGGHGTKISPPSASPFFSFAFLNAWFNGKNFHDALLAAWFEGSYLLKLDGGFQLAQMMAGYGDKEKALLGSQISYATQVEAQAITIKTDVRKISRNTDVQEITIK